MYENFTKTDYLMYHKFVEFKDLTREQVIEATGLRKIEIAKRLQKVSLEGLTLAIYEEGDLDNTVLNELPNNPFLPTVITRINDAEVMTVKDFFLERVKTEMDEEMIEVLNLLEKGQQK